MLSVGDAAPDFEGDTAAGGRIRLSGLRGRPVVLYFYPKARSLGCTRESIGFAHYYSAFQRAGVEVVGVSVDDVAAQSRFTEECSLPFPLVADAQKEIARRYGVLGAFGMARRVTFLLDASGHVIEVVDTLLPGPHVRQARARFLGGAVEGGAAPAAVGPPPSGP